MVILIAHHLRVSAKGLMLFCFCRPVSGIRRVTVEPVLLSAKARHASAMRWYLRKSGLLLARSASCKQFSASSLKISDCFIAVSRLKSRL